MTTAITTKRKFAVLSLCESVEIIRPLLQLLPDWEQTVYNNGEIFAQEMEQFPLVLFHIGDASNRYFQAKEHYLQQLEQLMHRARNPIWIGIFTEQQLQDNHYLQFINHHYLDYFTLPLILSEQAVNAILGHTLGLACIRRQQRQRESPEPDDFGIIGQCDTIVQLRKSIRKLACHNTNVIIYGASGTGKELVAQSLHQQSARSDKPFVAINWGAIADSLIEAELFGYEKGAFTGADRSRIGLIESAHGGTLFLDDIAELPPLQQVKLLRFLQEGTITPVGSTQQKKIDARIIAATHADLREQVALGVFREDLYYRLNVAQIKLPPLSERKTDIDYLAQYFLNRYQQHFTSNARFFTPTALRAMRCHAWPGNIREMINRIQKALIICESKSISPLDLGLPEPTSKDILSIGNL